MSALLDTNILVATESADEAPPDLHGFDDLLVSALSYAELARGMHLTSDLGVYKARARRLLRVQSTFGEGIPFDDDCLEMYGELLTRVLQRGGDPKARHMDRMIAATAMAHDLTIVTRNGKDFAMFEGLVDVVER